MFIINGVLCLPVHFLHFLFFYLLSEEPKEVRLSIRPLFTPKPIYILNACCLDDKVAATVPETKHKVSAEMSRISTTANGTLFQMKAVPNGNRTFPVRQVEMEGW